MGTYFGFTIMEWLNFVMLGVAVIFGVLLFKGKQQAPGDAVVEDPVTGEELTVKDVDYCTEWEGKIYYFESEDSREQFRRDPDEYLQRTE